MALRKFNDAIERQTGYISNNESVTPQQEMCCSTEEPLHLAVAKQKRKEYPYFTLVPSPEPDNLTAQPAEALRLIMQDAHAYAQLRFDRAAEIFLDHKKQEVKKITHQQIEYYIRALSPYFGGFKLCEIHIGHIKKYRDERLAPTDDFPEGMGPSLINHEVNVIAQMLEFAGRWDEVKKFYKPLKVGKSKRPRVMSDAEEQRFFEIVSRTEWDVAYWVASLTNNTTAYGCELRNLQLKDVDLQGEPPKFWVPDENVKNEFRSGRPITLNSTAYKQMCRVVERALSLGACKPEHYLFPFRVKRNSWDVTRPASESFIKKSFRRMVGAAGPEYSWLTPKCFRFQCVTKLCEAGADEQTIIAIAGWNGTKQMLNWYARPRIEHKQTVLNMIDPSRKKASPRQDPTASWVPKNNLQGA
jgi:hypothetical protein